MFSWRMGISGLGHLVQTIATRQGTRLCVRMVPTAYRVDSDLQVLSRLPVMLPHEPAVLTKDPSSL